MVSKRKCGKVYEYRIEIASIDGTRKWIIKSEFRTKQEALDKFEDYTKTLDIPTTEKLLFLD